MKYIRTQVNKIIIVSTRNVTYNKYINGCINRKGEKRGRGQRRYRIKRYYACEYRSLENSNEEKKTKLGNHIPALHFLV